MNVVVSLHVGRPDRAKKKRFSDARETCAGSYNGMLLSAVMTFLDIFQHLLINFIPKNEKAANLSFAN